MIQNLKTEKPGTANSRPVLSDIIAWLQKLTSYQEPLTLSGSGTITWLVERGFNASLNLTGNVTLSVGALTAGDYGVIKVKQSSSGGNTLTLPAGSKVSNGGAGAVTLTSTANAIDILSFYYDGTNLFWNISTDFT